MEPTKVKIRQIRRTSSLIRVIELKQRFDNILEGSLLSGDGHNAFIDLLGSSNLHQ